MPCPRSLAIAAATLAVAATPGAADGYVLFPKEHGPKRGYHACLAQDRDFADLDLTVRARRSAGITHYGVVFRHVDGENLYRLVLRTGQRDFRVEKVLGGVSDYATTRYVRFPSQANRWYEVRLSAIGSAVKVWVDGQLRYEGDGFSELRSGRVGVTVLATRNVRFQGSAVFLVHGRRPNGHLLKVTIDGDEYPPVETRGPAEFPVVTCLAVDLSPGEHELPLTPLLRWQEGTTVIGGIEVVAHD